MKELLNAKTSSLLEILGNGKTYKIPPFQRDYSWEEEYWQDLWDDFVFIDDSKNPHYMGTIVLKASTKDNEFEVIDGQQRLTTITLFIIAIIKFLEDLVNKGIDAEINKDRIDDIGKKYIGEKNLVTRHYESKIELNKNNNHFFQDKILRLEEPASYSKLNYSEKLLYDGYKYFYKKITDKFQNDAEKITSFLLTISNKTIFIKIIVDNELDAYTVFETLNSRGVPLTTTDLLKNYLLSLSFRSTPESQMGLLEERWNKIVHNIGFDEFPKFLRYYLNSRQKMVRHDQLFRIIKNIINDARDVDNLLKELEKKAVLYNAIKNPDDDFWNDEKHKNDIIKSLRELKLFGVSQPVPVLFSLYDNLPDLFHVILRDIATISFRYNVIGKKNPNELEIVYNLISQKISEKQILEKDDIYKELKKVYIDDEDFKQAFSTKDITTGGKNKKLVKYIFTKIENQINNQDNDYNDANFTIEHILPESFSEDWDRIFENNANKFIYRLGNYTILEDKLNRDCGNKSYDQKKEVYKISRYKLTNHFCLKDEWNISSINQYQKNLSNFASSVWKIQF